MNTITITVNNSSTNIEVDFINCNFTTKGTYYFDSSFSSNVTPITDNKRIDVVFLKNTVVYIGKINERVLIPCGDGYVVTFVGEDSIKYADLFKIGLTVYSVQVSNEATDKAYDLYTTNYTGIDTARGENDLIVYKSGKTTQTNAYGFEITVDENGYMVGYGHSGNIAIPANGFVLSGHGTSQKLLEQSYIYGARVILDDTNNTVTIIKTPELIVKNAENELRIIKDKLETSKSIFANLDYAAIFDEIKNIEDIVCNAQHLFSEYSFNESFASSEKAIGKCKALIYKLIESKGVENRAVWYRAVETNDDDVLKTVLRMKQLNINAVYLETWYEGYCIGKKVQVPGITVHPNFGDYDVLDGFVRICHEHGIEVHCWVQNFFTGYFYIDGPQYFNPTFGPENYGHKYLVDCEGKPNFYYSANGNYFIFLNPNDRECRDLILNIYRQLITKYDIDGLHLDYVRFPELNYAKNDFGYNKDIIDGFREKTGITKDPRTLAGEEKELWTKYRCDIVTSFMGEVYELVQSVNKSLWMSAATYPDLSMAKNEIFQDVASFVEKGYFDEIFSMSYGADNALVLRTIRPYVELTKNKAFYSSGIATFLETTKENFALQLTEAEQAGADGVAVFSLNFINPSTYENQIAFGAFREPAVQTYKGAETVNAQMNYIINKVKNISQICTILDEDDFVAINKYCQDVKTICADIDFKSLSLDKKCDWINSALTKIAETKGSVVTNCGENAETNAIICEFDDLEYWLNLTLKRLTHS